MPVTMRAEWSGGSVGDAMRSIVATMGKSVTAGVAAATEGAKTELRRQLTASGYHFDRAQNAIQGVAYPKPPAWSFNAAGVIGASGPAAERMLSAFSTGVIITPNKRQALAIPLHDFRGFGHFSALLGPSSSFFGGKLVFLPFRNHSGPGIGLLCSQVDRYFKARLRRSPGRARFAKTTPSNLIPQFLLISSARIPKILSPEEVVAKWLDRLPDLVAQAAEILDR